MNCFHAIATLVSMAIVVGSQDSSNGIQIKTFLLETQLLIDCPQGTVLTVLDAWFGDSDNCTSAIAMEPTGDGGVGSCSCKNVMHEMEVLIAQYEAYYDVDNSNALINWVSTDLIKGDACLLDELAKDPSDVPVQNLWVAYICEDPNA